jgi:excisionase family DNA binding protein
MPLNHSKTESNVAQPACDPAKTQAAELLLLTVDDVARLLQVCRATVRRLAKRGELKCRRLNRRLLRFHPTDVATYLNGGAV